MTPALNNGSGEGDSEERGDLRSSAAPNQRRRALRTRHRRGSRSALRRPVPGRSSTVWPCAQGELSEGTGLLASWLLTAVVKAVTTYTRPGQRVLLVEPARYLTRTGLPAVSDGPEQSRSGTYAGLHEAAWTVIRLGRGVQTETAVAGSGDGDRLDRQSGPGLLKSVDSPTAAAPNGPPPFAESALDQASQSRSPDLYDLVIAAAEPQTFGWFQPANWGAVLAPTGILAVFTHGYRERHRFADPASSLVRAATTAGLLYLDRITLLRTPVRDGALMVTTPAGYVRARTSTGPRTTHVRHVQVPDDLFVFTTPPAFDDGGESC